MIFILSNVVFSQEKIGDNIRKEIITDLCKYVLNNYTRVPEIDSKGKFVVLNIDLNYRSINIGSEMYSERYRYSDEKYDSLLLRQIAKTFSLSLEHNFISNNDCQDFEYLRSGIVSNDSILALNNFNGFNYLKIGRPIESWDMLYIMDDSASFFKYYKKMEGNKGEVSLHIPVIAYKYSSGAGIEYKFIVQYIVSFKKNQYTIKFKRKIDL